MCKALYVFTRITFTAIVLVSVLHEQSIAQQKMHFTQYMFNGLVINPAYAGTDEALSVTFIQRSQWAGIENAPSTQTLSGHTLFKQKRFGLGLTLVNDKIGVHKNLNMLSNYAYHLRVGGNAYASMGISAGVRSRKSDYASLIGTFGNNNDPKWSGQTVSHTSFDLGMGLYFRSPKFHAGISAPELIPERITINDTFSIQLSKKNFFVLAKYKIRLSENIDGEPSVLLKYLAGVPVSFDLNMNLTFRKVLTTGLSYRKSESLDFLLKAQVTPQLQFGYAYDYPLGEVAKHSNGSHEVMAHYLFRYVQTNVTSPR